MTQGAWAAALDDLERHLRSAEELASADGAIDAAPPAAWEPPALTEPMPRALLPRARELQLRQLAAQAALGDALAVVRGRQQLARRATHMTPAPATPAYVDVTA